MKSTVSITLGSITSSKQPMQVCTKSGVSHRFHRAWTLGAVALTLLVGQAGNAASVSTFDVNDEGWMSVDLIFGNPPTINNTYTLDYHAAGGNPGGYVSEGDPAPDHQYFSAPAGFLGNQLSVFNDVLCFDLLVEAPDAGSFREVILVGPSGTLYYDSTAPAAVWTTQVVPLSPAGWKLNDPIAGLQPTDAQMQAILGNLGALYINADWRSGSETVGLDNVRLGKAVPEPGAVGLMLGASVTGTFVAMRRRIRHK